MAKRSATAEPPVRKSFLVGGGIVIGIALLLFIGSKLIGGGGGGGDATSSQPPVASSSPAAAAGVPGSDNNPVTSNGAAGGSSQFPKNQLNPGGTNPFVPRAGTTSSAPAKTVVKALSDTAGKSLAKTHTWQLLDYRAGEGTFLVDGKKYTHVKVGDTIVEGYKLNSVTGACVTVKGKSVFGLCPGAAPFSA